MLTKVVVNRLVAIISSRGPLRVFGEQVPEFVIAWVCGYVFCDWRPGFGTFVLAPTR